MRHPVVREPSDTGPHIGAANRGLSRDERRWEKDAPESLFGLGRKVESKPAGNPAQFHRSLVDRA